MTTTDASRTNPLPLPAPAPTRLPHRPLGGYKEDQRASLDLWSAHLEQLLSLGVDVRSQLQRRFSSDSIAIEFEAHGELRQVDRSAAPAPSSRGRPHARSPDEARDARVSVLLLRVRHAHEAQHAATHYATGPPAR